MFIWAEKTPGTHGGFLFLWPVSSLRSFPIEELCTKLPLVCFLKISIERT